MTGQVIAFPGCEVPEPEPAAEPWDEWRVEVEGSIDTYVEDMAHAHTPVEWAEALRSLNSVLVKANARLTPDG